MRIEAPCYLFQESLHVIGSERWFEGYGFIYHTAKWPNIRLFIIRKVFPNLRTGIGWSSRLCPAHALSCLWNIHIPSLMVASLKRRRWHFSDLDARSSVHAMILILWWSEWQRSRYQTSWIWNHLYDEMQSFRTSLQVCKLHDDAG